MATVLYLSAGRTLGATGRFHLLFNPSASILAVYKDYPFVSNFLDVQGGRLHFIDEGTGPVIVMVHGNPTWSYYFRHLITFFKQNYRVIAVDHMGCGLSDKPPDYPYCLAQHIENLWSLLEYLKIDRFSLVVHDWGGAIGLGCGVKELDRLENIVIMNTAAFRSSRLPWRIRLCRLPIVGEIIVRLFNGFAAPARFMAVEKRLDRETARAYLAPYDSWQNRIAIARFVEDIPMHRDHKSYAKLVEIEERLDQVRAGKIPMMILWGGKDFCFNDLFFGEWRRRFPKAESHYFNDGGHYLLEDKGADIIPILQAFLAKEQ